MNTSTSQSLESTAARNSDEICAWIVAYVTELLEVEPDAIDPTVPFESYGLDSSAVVGMTGELEDWLGQELDPTLIYDYPTINALSKYLAMEK
jgi:acyl carrier protein